MKHIIVSAKNRDGNAYPEQKYDNKDVWNRVGGFAPTGVSATRWLKKTNPNRAELNSLAVWLMEHVGVLVAGRMPAHFIDQRVQVFSGRTEADRLRNEGHKNAENIIRIYNLQNVPEKIDDFLFPQILPDESDEEYWNRTALQISGLVGKSGYIQTGEHIWKN